MFYDDNKWVALADLQHHAMYDDPASVREASRLFDLVVSGWDSDRSHVSPGGVFWTQAPWSSDRNTVSNMPGAQVGLRSHQLTGRRYYLDWSLRMHRWTNRHLQRPDALFRDHLDLQGTVEKTIWSYNQGVPVSVNALLFEITGQRRYLDEAVRIADAATDFYAKAHGQATTLLCGPGSSRVRADIAGRGTVAGGGATPRTATDADVRARMPDRAPPVAP